MKKKTTKRIYFEQGAEEQNKTLEMNKKFKCTKSEHISSIFFSFFFLCLDVFSSFMVSILLVAFFSIYVVFYSALRFYICL